MSFRTTYPYSVSPIGDLTGTPSEQCLMKISGRTSRKRNVTYNKDHDPVFGGVFVHITNKQTKNTLTHTTHTQVHLKPNTLKP